MSIATDVTRSGFDAVWHVKGKRLRALAVPAVILGHFISIFFSFDIAGLADRARVRLAPGHEVLIEGNRLRYDVPGYGLIAAEVSRREGVALSLPTGTPPDWISVSTARVNITTEAGRVSLTRARTEVMRCHFGWEIFWFTLDSPFHGKSFFELVGLALSDERVVEGKSNLAAITHDIWTNRM